MTISKVIERVGQLRPTAISHEELANLVLSVEADIHRTYLKKPMPEIKWTDELSAPFPYDAVYLDFVIAKIDQYNGDTGMYALSSEQYAISRRDLAAYLIREGIAARLPKNTERYF